ncbi:cation:proton antiporter [Acidobacteriota bacterium]
MIVITIVLCISISYLFTIAAKKLNISVVIGMIISGIILGSPEIKRILIGSNSEFILGLGNLGFLTLMFLAGLEISWCMLFKERKEALALAFFAATIPIILGFSAFFALGFSLITCLIIGISMSITAEATKARVLLELNKLDTEVGSLMMGAGIIDDILGLILFAIVSYIFTGKAATHELNLTILAIGVFFLGILVHKFVGRHKKFVSLAERFLLLFLIPFFFINMGIHFSFQSILLNPKFLLIILAIAITGKITGSLAAKPFVHLSWKQLYLVGWGMNSRGAVELALALLAYQAGLIERDIYSGLVLMALTTTLIFPFIIRKMIKKNPDIMGETSKGCVIPKHLMGSRG